MKQREYEHSELTTIKASILLIIILVILISLGLQPCSFQPKDTYDKPNLGHPFIVTRSPLQDKYIMHDIRTSITK